MISFVVKRWEKGGFQRSEIIIAILFLLLLIPTLRGVSEQSDVDIFHAAALRLRNGLNMYLAPYMYGMWYYYSPLFASILVPFTWCDIRVLKLCWYLFNLFLVFRSYRLIRWYFSMPEDMNGILFVSFMALVSFPLVFLNLLYGQLTILMLWCCIEGIYRFLLNQTGKGAFAFAIAINIKVLPIIFFYAFLIKQKWKYIVSIFLAFVILIYLPYLWINYSFHSVLIHDWLGLLNPLNSEHIETIGEGGFTDFASILIKYFTANKIPGETALNVSSFGISQVFLIQMIYRILVLFLIAWVVLKLHKRKFEGRLLEFADLAFVLACIPTAFPHQRDYSMLLCLPAMGIVFYNYFILAIKPTSGLLLLLIVDFFMLTLINLLDYLGPEIKLFLHQTRITGIAAILFLPLYVIVINDKFVKVADIPKILM